MFLIWVELSYSEVIEVFVKFETINNSFKFYKHKSLKNALQGTNSK